MTLTWAGHVVGATELVKIISYICGTFICYCNNIPDH